MHLQALSLQSRSNLRLSKQYGEYYLYSIDRTELRGINIVNVQQ
jgi:hypothetical protein